MVLCTPPNVVSCSPNHTPDMDLNRSLLLSDLPWSKQKLNTAIHSFEASSISLSSPRRGRWRAPADFHLVLKDVRGLLPHPTHCCRSRQIMPGSRLTLTLPRCRDPGRRSTQSKVNLIRGEKRACVSRADNIAGDRLPSVMMLSSSLFI